MCDEMIISIATTVEERFFNYLLQYKRSKSMFKEIKRGYIAAILALLILFAFTSELKDTLAADEDNNEIKDADIYFMSGDVPDYITEGAVSFMSGFSQESYEHLGYDKQQISGLYLAQPLTEYSYEDFPGRCTVFIYPVMNYENKIIGILNAGIDAEGRNTYDFGKTFYCDLLNELTEESETLSLISTRSSIWAINEKSELTLLQDFFLGELVIPEVTFKEVVMVNNKKINLTENKIFIRSEDGKNSILANSAPDSESGPDIYTTAASEQNLNLLKKLFMQTGSVMVLGGMPRSFVDTIRICICFVLFI